MGTQGLVTIVKNRKVAMKFVGGQDGQLAQKLARKLKNLGEVPTVEAGFKLAQKIGFGGNSLVVFTETEAQVSGGEDLTSSLYHKTFNDPRFNPRWEHGTADHVCIVEL